ncbi:MAG: hypothetical protein NWE94_07590 [Candidatus Bathyarchaeota archaeon]|nr:hypothetical protein [Candidatus Bathyarchaeota archaeon]
MPWNTWLCLALAVLGVVLFLYGANYYDAVVGWAGVFLFLGAVLAFLIWYIYSELTRR